MDAFVPMLLVAAPSLTDPRFRRSVLLLAESGEDGALGFVLNRRTPYTFGQLADEIGIVPRAEVLGDVVYYGGPVSPERGWLVFENARDLGGDDEAIIEVGDSLRVSATLSMLDRLLTRASAPPFRLYLGYAGWGPSQLEEEIREGSWLPLDLDPAFIFDVPPDDAWELAIRKLGLDPGGFMMGRGGSA